MKVTDWDEKRFEYEVKVKLAVLKLFDYNPEPESFEFKHNGETFTVLRDNKERMKKNYDL